MTGHLDEVSFLLDGLKNGQPVKTRRATLLSLLSICSPLPSRIALRDKGISTTIIGAILGLSLDDASSNLAAAALFFLLTKDGHDKQVLESPSYIRFLINLLQPVMSTATCVESRKEGCKLLSLLKDPHAPLDATQMSDLDTTAIVSKVEELLVSCKEIESISRKGSGTKRPELNPKWIALLTMEKACFYKISVEDYLHRDTSDIVTNTARKFKEHLRELGGLDAIFELAMTCSSVVEGCIGNCSLQYGNIYLMKQSLMLLLKCLKVMHDSTVMNKDNQDHLLGIKEKLNCYRSRPSFTEYMIRLIKILAGLYLRRSLSGTSSDDISSGSVTDYKVQKSEPLLTSFKKCSNKSSERAVLHHSQDPFAFDEIDCEPSKWNLSSKARKKHGTKRSQVSSIFLMSASQQKLSSRLDSKEGCNPCHEVFKPYVPDEECSSLLADCVLDAVKVLLALSHENHNGCRQIGAYGGLETISWLLVTHFPSFRKHITDHQLEYLLAILGLLVNLVEKDGHNRSRLAATTISLRNVEGLEEESDRDIVPLLCSIFLANQRTGETVHEDEEFAWEESDNLAIEAYTALLLAFLSIESKSIRNSIADQLPNQKLEILVPALERFADFHLTLNLISPEAYMAVSEAIKSCKVQ